MVTDKCVRGKASVCSYILDDVAMQKVVKGGVLRFIGYGGIKNWIVLCYSLQDWFEIVAMYENRMTRVNGMKKVR